MVCVCVSVSLLSIFDVFHVSYESRLAYTIKAHPDAFKARNPA